MDQGRTQLGVKFDKNVFFGNEVANSNVTVDNHECKLRITEVEFQVVQRMRLSGYHSWSGKFDVIENKDQAGMDAGYTEPVTKIMTLNLDACKYSISNQRAKKCCARSDEEMFLLTNLAPAAHSHHISNDYELNVNVKYDGCTCCSSVPNVSIPLSIIPMTH